MQLFEIEAQRPFTLHSQCLTQDVRRDKRIAVTIPSDPAADPQKRGHIQPLPLRFNDAELILEAGIKAWQLAQECLIVKAQSVGDLVDHPQSVVAQNTGLPQ